MSTGTQRAVIAFMHVPKTLGTSVQNSIIKALGISEFVSGSDSCLYGNIPIDEIDKLSTRHKIYMAHEEIPRGKSFIGGHMAYSTLMSTYPEGRIITIVREPRSRLLSHWLYWRSFSYIDLRHFPEWGKRVAFSHGSLVDFLNAPSIACQTDNLLLRMLLWPHPLIPDEGFIAREADAELLDAARTALQSLSFIGSTEEPHLSMRLSEFLGTIVDLGRENATAASSVAEVPILAEELQAAALDALRDRTRLDAILWAEAMIGIPGTAPPAALAEQAFHGALLRYIGRGVVHSCRNGKEAAERVAAATARHAADEARNAALSRQVDALVEQLSCLTGRLQASDECQQLLRERLRRFEESRSWRLTAPLRGIASGLRRRRPN